MPKSILLLLLTPCLLACPARAVAQLATLTVVVHSLEPQAGKLEVSLFNSAEDFLKKPLLQQTVAVDSESEELEFAALVDGEYAVVVVHDANDNGALDAGFLGFGGEGYGYSNNPISLFGRPSFDAARFTVGTENLSIEIDLD